MNPEALQIIEIVVGSAAGLAAIYYGGRAILNGLRSRRGSIYQNDNDVSSALPDILALPTSTGSSQVSPRDQRPTIFRPPSNRGNQHSRTCRGNKIREKR